MAGMGVSSTYRALCWVERKPVNRVARAAVHMQAFEYARRNSTPLALRRAAPGRLASAHPGGVCSRGVSWSLRNRMTCLPVNRPCPGPLPESTPGCLRTAALSSVSLADLSVEAVLDAAAWTLSAAVASLSARAVAFRGAACV